MYYPDILCTHHNWLQHSYGERSFDHRNGTACMWGTTFPDAVLPLLSLDPFFRQRRTKFMVTIYHLFKKFNQVAHQIIICLIYSMGIVLPIRGKVCSRLSIPHSDGVIVFENISPYIPRWNDELALVFSTHISGETTPFCAIPFNPSWFNVTYLIV